MLHDAAGAHYEEDLFPRADVLQRVVGDGDEVDGVAGGEAADFVFEAEGAGGDGGGGAEGIFRGEAEADHDGELPGGGFLGEDRVGAEGDGDAGGEGGADLDFDGLAL